MSAGFCNWVYRVQLEGSEQPIMVKLFSPLAKLRLAPERRGLGDETAGDEALGPRLLYRSADGLICEWIEGETLTEADLHAPSSSLPALIAPKLAALHGEPLAAVEAGDADGPVLWQFLHAMIEQIALGADALPEGFTLAELRAEVERMRRRCDALRLPVVRGHGDLKPSNVMHLKRAAGAPSDRPAVGGDGDVAEISFIDFELSGYARREPGQTAWPAAATACFGSLVRARVCLRMCAAATTAATTCSSCFVRPVRGRLRT